MADGVNSNIVMSFASFLQHNSTKAALSQITSIESEPAYLFFKTEPPNSTFVNEIFKVEVVVGINGGTPLPNAKVTCNITKDIESSDISKEIFNSLASANFNIQKSNLLFPSSKLDENRTSGITNNQGIARLYLRIKESPLNAFV